jgi:outer membrane protein assembly factor BamB
VRNGLVVEAPDLQEVSVWQANSRQARWNAADAGAVASRLGPDRLWLDLEWLPGQHWRVELTRSGRRECLNLTAPLKPSPLLVASIGLEDVDYTGPNSGGSPNTEVSFSPDGKRLAIGSYGGWLRVVECRGGREVFSRKMAEGMVKRIVWSRRKGRQVLFVGEQSPDGFLYCLDAESGDEIWRYRTADDVDTSTVSADDSRNRIYNLPGIYQLRALDNGDLLAVSTHGWYKADQWISKCVVYGFSGEDGRRKWRWPRKDTFPHSITWFGASDSGGVLAFTPHRVRPAEGKHPVYPGGLFYCLNGENGKLLWKYAIPPLKPYYSSAGTWQGICVAPDGRHLFLGLNDGRAMLFSDKPRRPPAPLWVRNLGTPVMVGDVPVTSAVNYASMTNNAVYLGLPNSIIPSSAGSQRNRRPTPHPMSNYLVALDMRGRILWNWHSQGTAQGVFVSGDGRWVATAVTSGRTTPDLNLFGLTLFDTARPGGGANKLVFHLPTMGPLHFQGAVSPKGRYLAVSEFPYSRDEGKTIYGRYQVHIIH